MIFKDFGNSSLDFVLNPNDPEFTLSKVLSPELDLLSERNIQIMVKMGETSSKEFQIEVALDKMQNGVTRHLNSKSQFPR